MMIARGSGKEKAAAGFFSFIGTSYAEQNTATSMTPVGETKTR
jgi:hypothetical protein